MIPSPVLGQPVSRVEGAAKVTGSARYAAEIHVPDLHIALLLGSHVPHGRIRTLDTAAAEAIPGVVGVLTHRNMPRLGTDIQTFPLGTAGTKLLPMQSDEILHEGQYVACVVARSIEAAGRALGALNVEYDELPPVTFAGCLAGNAPPQEIGSLPDVRVDAQQEKPDAHGPGAGDLAPHELPEFLAKGINAVREDPDAGLAAAEVTAGGTFDTPPIYQSPIEIGATIAVPAAGDKLTVYDSTQHILGVRNALSRVLEMPLENIRVVAHYVGGGFGAKCFTWPHTMIAAAAARKFGVPVKLFLNREQMFHGMGYRAPMRQRLTAGATRDGKLTVLLHDAVSATSMSDVDIPAATEMTKTLYACPNLRTRQAVFRCHVATPCRMRAPGEAIGLFALESTMDELAYKLGLDPVELRRRNYAAAHPETGKPWSTNALLRCYEEGAARFGWSGRAPLPGARVEGDWSYGVGMSSAIYPTMMSPVRAKVRLLAEGIAVGQAATQEIGQGSITALTQIVADALGLPVRLARFEMGDTDFPPAPVSGASRGAVSVGSAVQAAGANLRRKLIALAVSDARSPLAGCPEDQVEAARGGLYLRTDLQKGEAFETLLERRGISVVEAEGEYFPLNSRPADLDVIAKGTTRTLGPNGPDKHIFTYGANFIEVRVHRATCRVEVTRALGVFGAGRILNPKLAQSQAMGGMAFGIGFALTEEAVGDPRTGRLVSTNLADYHLPQCAVLPDIETHFVEEDDQYISPLGAKGVGEIGTTGSAAAVANAVFHAIGKRVRSLPITAEKLL